MVKAMDLLMWNLEVADREKVLPVIFELADKVQSEHGIRVRPMRRRQLRKDLDSFAEVYNSAWSQNWDFVPYSKKDLDAYAQELQLVFDKHWFFIAEKEDTGEVVGMAMTIPDLNQVLEKMNGRAAPLGWWHFAAQEPHHRPRARGLPGRQARVPAHRRGGQALRRALQRRRRAPQKGGEMGWILETNQPMNRGMEAMGGRDRQALPRVRASVLEAPRTRGLGRPLHFAA